MREKDIRAAVRCRLATEFAEQPGTLIVDELGLCQGAARVDLAAVNGLLHGYEIKSDQDTLDRLPGQLLIYSRVLDTVHMVAAGSHLARIERIVPDWWGLIEASPGTASVDLAERRAARRNPAVDPFAVAQLLWREEALAVLSDVGLADGLMNKPRRVLWQRLADLVPVEELCAVVRDQLRSRSGWRSAQ